MKKEFKSLDEFYIFYLDQHKKKTTRLLHTIGTLGGTLIFISGIILRNPYLLFIAFLFGYGLAWIGHFCFEKNMPATLKWPLYSFICDWKMLIDVILRRF